MKTKLSKLSNDKLIDIVKHYRLYHYKREIKQVSIEILQERGMDTNMLTQFKSDREVMINQLEKSVKEFQYFGRLTLLFYFLSLFISYFILDTTVVTYMIIGFVCLLFYMVYYLLMYSRYYDFYKKLDGNAHGATRQIAFFLAGFPLCFLAFYYSLREMRKELLDRY